MVRDGREEECCSRGGEEGDVGGGCGREVGEGRGGVGAGEGRDGGGCGSREGRDGGGEKGVREWPDM